MKPSYEKLVPPTGKSFRCFDRSTLRSEVRWHRHPEIELTYLPRGSGFRVVGDCIDSYTDHDLVLSGSELPHSWSSDEYRGQKYDEHQAFVLQFHCDVFGREFLECSEMSKIVSMFNNARRGLWFPVEAAIPIGKQMESLITAVGAQRFIGLLSILHELSQCEQPIPLASQWYDTQSIQPSSDPIEARVRDVCDYVSKHLSDFDLGPGKLAELAEMDPSAFGRFFKQVVGRTPTTYIAELKIGLACRLLTDTDDSVLSICHQSGFANLSNFNRRFLQHRQMTPRQYRARFRLAT